MLGVVGAEGALRPAGLWPALDSSRFQLELHHFWNINSESDPKSRLVLKTSCLLPKGKATLMARSEAPFTVEFGGETAKSGRDGAGFKAEATAEVETDVVDLTWTFDKFPWSFAATYHTADNPTERSFTTDQLVLTWAPARPSVVAATPVPEAVLKGGDAAKGAVVFKSEQVKCATCHKVRGEGGDVGPDLSEVFRRDRSWVYRQINEPSAPIHPDYVPYTVLTKDGRVLAGIVRAEGGDAIRVVDTEGKSSVVKKAEIEELKPSATSIMPVGLLGTIGEEGVRDLIAFLTASPPAKR